MTTQADIDAAAERYAKWKNGNFGHNPMESPYFNCDGDDPSYIHRARVILADAYLASRQWQDEPDEDGAAYWVHGIGVPCQVSLGADLQWYALPLGRMIYTGQVRPAKKMGESIKPPREKKE